uniref:Transposase (Putative), gypsy type n=1 Tax=Tanacetum cinerariifolium TaxID=118510 RepID=A0A6L2NUV0_TANCI|nr:hypothetical protein [Tanacetum cinerariifolium]
MHAVGAASEGREEEVAAQEPRMSKKYGRRGNDGADANAPPKVLRKDYVSVRPEHSTRRGKSLLMKGLAAGVTFIPPADTKGVNDPEPLSYAEPQPHPERSMTQSYEIPNENEATIEVQDTRSAKSAGSRKLTSSPSMFRSPKEIYQPGWGVTNSCRLDTPDACQDVLDHIVPPGLLKKARAQIASRDQRIQVREEEIKKLDQEIQDLQVGHDQLTQQVSTLQAQVTGEEKLKAAFEEFKKYEDDRVEKRCAEIDVCLDALSIDFDKELYPHMITVIAGREWVIGYGLRLAVMKCGESIELRQVFADVLFAGIAMGMSEGLKYGVEHGKANLDLEAIEAYDLEAETKYVAALHTLKDLKYPRSDFEEDAPQWIRELRPSSSQLKILVYPEVRDPKDLWAFKEEILLADAIAANVSRAEKKKKRRVQGLAILLADAATQTETFEDGASSRICTCGVACAPWESSSMHLTS